MKGFPESIPLHNTCLWPSTLVTLGICSKQENGLTGANWEPKESDQFKKQCGAQQRETPLPLITGSHHQERSSHLKYTQHGASFTKTGFSPAKWNCRCFLPRHSFTKEKQPAWASEESRLQVGAEQFFPQAPKEWQEFMQNPFFSNVF